MMDVIRPHPNPIVERILKSFGLTHDQYRAAATRGCNIVVTAGAGSGKTRTLVARYMSLLAEKHSPRRVVAITFTEKAAREMRSRVRAALGEQIAQAGTAEERQAWIELDAQMDAARIGTIHSLCAEILRSHPAEAGLDPRFEVLEEGLAATLRAQAVQDTLAWLIDEQELALLLTGFKTIGLQQLLAYLLDHRLEAQIALDRNLDIQHVLVQVLQSNLAHKALADPLAMLTILQSSVDLRSDAGDKLAEQVEDLLNTWRLAEQELAGGDGVIAAQQLFTARRQKMKGNIGPKTSLAKAMVADLKEAYDRLLDPWIGGAGASDPLPDQEVEQLFVQVLPLVRQAFQRLINNYQSMLHQRQTLDFDDLEDGAWRLLKQKDLSRRWQNEIDALLVDEFQDTNARQREIVLALCGETPGRLFVVGDARQSIYRFRQADVTVFRNLQQDIQHQGGLVINLDLTYRAHASLLQTTGDLLAKVMGDEPDPDRPYYIPYSPLHSNHELPRTGLHAPHVEYILGIGDDAEKARPATARALTQRLHELHLAGQIQHWDDVALLFRASTGFPVYEDAFEAAGIPFVTVAGQGFYNRPEIRDLLNLLRALADPWDDLAMAGLLRSPAFGLSDAALYHMRCQTDGKLPYWEAIKGDLGYLPEPDRGYADRAREILEDLQQFTDRLPVAELLKRLVDRVDYRAILASTHADTGRLWRNLDKLIADAQTSGMVNLHSFLGYLDTLRDVGAREGEAPAEAEGAVRLMTIHKAKGLEFPVVILADAARQRPKAGGTAYLLPDSCPAFKIDQLESTSLIYRLARFQDTQQAEAEEKRLLYVALTRAQEKLLISGHCTVSNTGWKTSAWLQELIQASSLDLSTPVDSLQVLEANTSSGNSLRFCFFSAGSEVNQITQPPALVDWPVSSALPLYPSLLQSPPETVEPKPAETLLAWRATGEQIHPPADILGRLVHQAIQRWTFLKGPRLVGLLESTTLEARLADPAQRAKALRLTQLLLTRLQHHPLWLEIGQAKQRYHEVPYSYITLNNHLDTGYIDLLYQTSEGWQIIDFKTDSLNSTSQRKAAINRYRPQMRRYAQAAQYLLGKIACVRMCFLDDEGRISLVEV